MTTPRHYNHQRAMLRHGARVCPVCKGDGWYELDAYTLEQLYLGSIVDCTDCDGTGLDTEEMNTLFTRVGIRAYRVA